MKIFIDGLIFSLQRSGGISRYFYQLVQEYISHGNNLDVELIQHTSLLLSEQNKLPSLKILETPRSQWKLLQHLREQLFWRGLSKGVLHNSYYELYPSLSIPQVITVYDFIHEKWPQYFDSGRPYHDFVSKKKTAIEKADQVICISEITKQDLLSRYQVDPNKISVIHLAPAPLFTATKSQLSTKLLPDYPFFLYVGSRATYKNTSYLIKSFQSWKSAKDIHLLFVGDTWSKDELELIQKLGLEKKVHSVKALPDVELLTYYHKAIALINPSLDEGFGLPALEAMACGTPVILSDIPAHKEVAAMAGVYFVPRSTESLHEAMETMLKNRIHYSEKSLERSKMFTWRKTAQSTLDVYQKALTT